MNETERPPDDFANAFETAFARLQVRIEEGCAGRRDWASQVAAAVQAGLDFAVADPGAMRVLAIDSLAQGAEGIARHERLIGYLAELLAPGRKQQPHGESLPDVAERAMAGGVMTLIGQRLDEGREGELRDLAPDMIQFVLTPYLGAERAARVAARGDTPSG